MFCCHRNLPSKEWEERGKSNFRRHRFFHGTYFIINQHNNLSNIILLTPVRWFATLLEDLRDVLCSCIAIKMHFNYLVPLKSLFRSLYRNSKTEWLPSPLHTVTRLWQLLKRSNIKMIHLFCCNFLFCWMMEHCRDDKLRLLPSEEITKAEHWSVIFPRQKSLIFPWT